MDHQVIRTHRLEIPEGGVIKAKQLDDKLDATQAQFNAKLTAVKATAITDVTGTADLTYSANEVTLINDTKTQLNALLAALRTAGIITT